MKRAEHYTALIQHQILSMFEEGSENYIDPQELTEGDNATAFIHSLATLAPTLIYHRLTNENVDILSFNHIANRIIVQSEKTQS